MMRDRIHDLVRALVALWIRAFGLALEIVHRRRVRSFRSEQDRLRKLYGIEPSTPIRDYGPAVRAEIERFAARSREPVTFVTTSGSTAEPKRIAYTKARLRRVKWAYMESFSRVFFRLRVKRTSLYVFAAMGGDDTLTGMMLEERGLPPLVSCLQAPYRVQVHPAIAALASRYGNAAVRTWVLALSNPGVLYATNPSTLSSYLSELSATETSALVRDVLTEPASFDPIVHRIARRISSFGWRERLEAIARADRPLTLEDVAPGVEAYACWTGGYVRPFLERLERLLPAARYLRIPMYSMSTETIETTPHFMPNGTICFLPVSPGVLVELLEESEPDEPERLIRPEDAEVGRDYLLVVSDAYGLRRYQTGDVFRVERKVEGLPDLAFLRRRGLAYSFTGEKITAEHAELAFSELRSVAREDLTGRFLSLMPSSPSDRLPHYKLLVIGEGDRIAERFASEADRALAGVNAEYAHKRESGRLGPVEGITLEVEAMAQRLGKGASSAWESQLKFLPLYTRTWESLDD
jgi:hypothetical protein